MDIITKCTEVTWKVLDLDEVIDSFTQKEYRIAEKILKFFKGKDIKIGKEQAREVTENGLIHFWGEFFKCLIVLTIACYLDIFLSTFLIMNTFSVLRALAGGVHMSTFNKCFTVMIVFFLSLGYVVNNIQTSSMIIFVFLTLGLIWNIIMAYKYSPQERPDKTDKDCNNGNKMKHRTIKFIIISYILCLLFIHNLLVSLSIFTGIILEMFTITPIGIKIFQWIDKGKVF